MEDGWGGSAGGADHRTYEGTLEDAHVLGAHAHGGACGGVAYEVAAHSGAGGGAYREVGECAYGVACGGLHRELYGAEGDGIEDWVLAQTLALSSAYGAADPDPGRKDAAAPRDGGFHSNPQHRQHLPTLQRAAAPQGDGMRAESAPVVPDGRAQPLGWAASDGVADGTGSRDMAGSCDTARSCDTMGARGMGSQWVPQLEMLTAMGFPWEQSLEMLSLCDGDTETAIQLMCS
uniref:UBA domain-containing protein n=1 Tax=Haptolina ericina TaxID=156174 RepID=A0A7S3AH74_9EUKA